MPNRLAEETSPYLLQHADNPVDWYPWGKEALTRARAEDRPLLVSIGYSACHWCHVMAHESFEDPAVAALMNERFVCVKVDREERPDVDAVCMEACQTMTGQGGWPLHCFLTPDQVPFFAGTYFPPQNRPGMPSWTTILQAIADAWRERRAEVHEQGRRLASALGGISNLPGDDGAIVPQTLDGALRELRGPYDARHGGFGTAPKFPQASLIEFLLARGEREMALGSLRGMARGGIYDQVGGGFARYAVDATWTVPHFEKMLYDNALLAPAYLHGWQVSGDPLLRRVCEETLEWALREMRGPEGGFLSALDADSEGVEGRYYVWTVEQLREALGSDELAEEALSFFGATEPGNFEGANVLEGRGPEPASLREIQARLYEARERRVRPGTDDKRLCSWNALMISALAEAGSVLGRGDWLEAAVRCAEFIDRELRPGDPADPARALLRTYRDGRAHIPAYLEDHAYLLEALLTLYESTGEERWYLGARRQADELIERFADPERGGFLTTATDGGSGFARRKDLDDAPIPSGNSSAAFGLLRLARLTGESRYEQHALGVLCVVAPIVGSHPLGFGHALRALDFALARVREVAIVGAGPDAEALLDVVRGAYRPHRVLAAGPGQPAVAEGSGEPAVPLLRGRPLVHGRATAYVCEGFACRAPVTDPAALAAALT
ncbi:MAG TPA: thioredoxin domain-containing protein [Solirubrobacteraceae bacterium]|nr:thioredoxin domain-containing protein [Solirubrobacteraceae bacterium]